MSKPHGTHFILPDGWRCEACGTLLTAYDIGARCPGSDGAPRERPSDTEAIDREIEETAAERRAAIIGAVRAKEHQL